MTLEAKPESLLRFCMLAVAMAAAIGILNALWLRSVDGWILVTSPTTGHAWWTNSVLGYSTIFGEAPFHKENVSPLYQALSFKGFFTTPDLYYLRATYPFLVSVAAIAFDLVSAALLINYLAYGATAAMTVWLARRLGGDAVAAAFAGLLWAIAIGPVVHLNDLSAHMLGFASYAAATCVVYGSGVWRERRPFRVHLAVGGVLALATLTYPTGLILTIAYVLVSVRHLQIGSIAVAAAIGLAARDVWQHFLELSYRTVFAHKVGPLHVIEAYFRSASARRWLAVLDAGIVDTAQAVFWLLLDALFVMFPPITILGFGAVLIVGWKCWARLWMLALFVLGPYAGMMYYSQLVEARGYLVYCSAFVLCAALAVAIQRLTKSRGAYAAILVALIVMQAAWSLVPYFGYWFPAAAYFVGLTKGLSPVASEVINITGEAPLWRPYGGSADFVAAGGLVFGPGQGALPRAYALGLLTTGFMVTAASLTAGLFACWGARPRLVAIGLVIATGVTVTLAGATILPRGPMPAVFRIEALSRLQDQKIRLSITLSAEAQRRMVGLLTRDPDLEAHVFSFANGVSGWRVEIDGESIPAVALLTDQRLLVRLSSETFLRALARGGKTLVLELAFTDGTIGGWQRAPAGGRTVEPALTAGTLPYVPSLEIRLVNRVTNVMKFLGY